MAQPGKIQKLDETVINRIAAGEVIQRPANALKEMIENSLDAKSSNIQVIVKNGGLKMLQIQDNGTGIRKDDFEIVCERFTTSKLREFEDLSSIATYGFRGEALASISHVAHLTILSKTAAETCAYRASFIDGKLKEPPKPAAGNQGTQIIVEDLFYNMAVRKRALRSPAEEYQKIADVVGKYAIHNATVGFALKKHGENNDIRTPPNSNTIDNIRTIYGNNIAREFIDFETENQQFKFKVKGYMTNVNYSSKKFIFLLFINHRLVDCSSLKKCLDQVYTTYLPKNTHPFIYMSLELDPRNIDVNVHPTKHEVHFMNEDQIVEIIMKAVETKLLGSNNSRVFYTQSKLPVVINETMDVTDKKAKTTYDKDLVRTDSSDQKLEKFFGAPIKKSEAKQQEIDALHKSMNEEEFKKVNEEFLKKNESFEGHLFESVQNELKNNENHQEKKSEKTLKAEKKIMSPLMTKINKVDTNLNSILVLRLEIENNCHMNLRQLFSQHVFVGCINPQQSLIQFSTKLYLCNTKKIMQEMFYQFLLYNFENFDYLKFSEPLSVKELALEGLQLPEAGWTPEDGDKIELASRIAEILTDKGEMLMEYFSMEIDENGMLKSLPVLIENHSPELSGLPMYLIRLATEVNWDIEKDCFQSFAKETSLYYSHLDEDEEAHWKFITEYIMYPAIKDYLLPPKSFTESAVILQVADLPSLYKVFERC